MPAEDPGSAPTSSVVNLSEVFGGSDETKKFVTRYLKATHCDLFFADAAIFVEGPAERMLVPHFIQSHFPTLRQRYITLLEIGGSHAHRLRPLIEHLGLITLVITDLDAAEPTGQKISTQPVQGKGQITRNPTLKGWHPEKTLVDDLFTISGADKVKKYDPLFSVRIAYQSPVSVQQSGISGTTTVYSNTFEDALVFENLSLFKELSGDGLIKKFKDAIHANSDLAALGREMFEFLKNGDKAKFALDLLSELELEKLNIPTYIKEGLFWLDEQLKRKQREVLSKEALPTAAGEGK